MATEGAETEDVEFRCCRCGRVEVVCLRKGYHALRLTKEPHPMKPPAPTCPACGAQSWVRVGSTTEYYAWYRRTDVCRVGNHVDDRAVEHVLHPRVPSKREPGTLRLESLSVRACPDHVEQLRTHGMHGFYLLGEPPASD